MQIWSEIQKNFENEWVAMAKWEEDSYGDVCQGEVVYHSANRKEFYDIVKSKYANKDLAIRYTGDVEGPFLLTPLPHAISVSCLTLALIAPLSPKN